MEGTADIWKLWCCGTLGMITDDPIIHLKLILVTRHTTHTGLTTILQYVINNTNYIYTQLYQGHLLAVMTIYRP